jgi:hypothetical protein
MPALSLARWAEFEGDFGPLTLHERLDALLGMVAFTIARAGGAKDAQAADFRPRWRRQRKLTDEDIWKWLGAVKSAPKVRPD